MFVRHVDGNGPIAKQPLRTVLEADTEFFLDESRREPGAVDEQIRFERFCDMRYHGQAYEIAVPLGSDRDFAKGSKLSGLNRSTSFRAASALAYPNTPTFWPSMDRSLVFPVRAGCWFSSK